MSSVIKSKKGKKIPIHNSRRITFILTVKMDLKCIGDA